MNFIFITAIYDDTNNDSFDNYFSPSIKGFNSKCIRITDKKEKDEFKKISDKYNIGINVAKENKLLAYDTIVIFAKSNVNIIDSLLLEKIRLVFDADMNISIVGVSGVREINEECSLYSDINKPVNGLIYHKDGVQGNYIKFSEKGFFDNIIGVDDSLFAVRGSFIINENFNFVSNINKGMGLDICIESVRKKYTSVVADILIATKEDNNLSYNDISKLLNTKGINSFAVNSDNIPQDINSVVEIEL